MRQPRPSRPSGDRPPPAQIHPSHTHSHGDRSLSAPPHDPPCFLSPGSAGGSRTHGPGSPDPPEAPWSYCRNMPGI